MPTGGESTIALEQLDSHVKAMLKHKLRAFVHLNPCFEDTHSIDMGARPANTSVRAAATPAPAEKTVTAAPAARTEIPLFPPIPERELIDSPAEAFSVQQFTANLAYSVEKAAQPCHNRLAAARQRRRARA